MNVRAVLPAACVIFALAFAPACSKLAGDTYGDAVRRLNVFDGVWQTHIDRLQTDVSRAGAERYKLANRCRPATDGLTCEQNVDGKPVDRITFRYTHRPRHYDTSIQTPGVATIAHGSLSIDGNVWTFPYKAKDLRGKPVSMRVINVIESPVSIAYREEFSRDGRTWTVSARGRESKLE